VKNEDKIKALIVIYFWTCPSLELFLSQIHVWVFQKFLVFFAFGDVIFLLEGMA